MLIIKTLISLQDTQKFDGHIRLAQQKESSWLFMKILFSYYLGFVEAINVNEILS